MKEIDNLDEIKNKMQVIYAPINTSAYKWFSAHLVKADGKYYLLEVSGVYYTWLDEVKQYFPEVAHKII